MDFVPENLEFTTNPVDVWFQSVEGDLMSRNTITIDWTPRAVAQDASAHQLIQEVNEAIDRYKSREGI